MEAFDSSSMLLRCVADLISSLVNHVDEEKEEVVDRYQKILKSGAEFFITSLQLNSSQVVEKRKTEGNDLW